MPLVNFPGFPDQIGEEYIEFPEPMEILREPMFAFASAENIRKIGSNFQKRMLDKAPLENKLKYVFFSCQVRVACPGYLLNKVEFPHYGSTRNEWHADVMGQEEGRVHAICNTLPTEFNTKPITFDVPEEFYGSYLWFCKQSAKHAEEWALTGESAPTNQFVTFQHHIHRAPIPTKRELRYFIRILETNEDMNPSKNYIRQASKIFTITEELPNVIQHSDGSVILHFR